MEYPIPTGTICILKLCVDSPDRYGSAGDYRIYTMEYKGTGYAPSDGSKDRRGHNAGIGGAGGWNSDSADWIVHPVFLWILYPVIRTDGEVPA